MSKQTITAIVGFILAITVTACGKSTANSQNFGTAISTYLAENGELCLGLNKWPLDIKTEDFTDSAWRRPGSPVTKMDALAAAGLVAYSEETVDLRSSDGRSPYLQKMRRYKPTPAAKPFFRTGSRGQGMADAADGDLCYGKRSLLNVTRWEGPETVLGTQRALVHYTAKVDLAPWSNLPDVQAAFPKLKGSAAGERAEILPVVLTDRGWIVAF
ncbi:MAG: hypothetical protein ACN6OP_16520 [Pseudomonadales bacterium]